MDSLYLLVPTAESNNAASNSTLACTTDDDCCITLCNKEELQCFAVHSQCCSHCLTDNYFLEQVCRRNKKVKMGKKVKSAVE